MLALEVWYFQVLILLAGMLPDPQVALDSLTVWWVPFLADWFHFSMSY
jgi:hypothetical protein